MDFQFHLQAPNKIFGSQFPRLYSTPVLVRSFIFCNVYYWQCEMWMPFFTTKEWALHAPNYNFSSHISKLKIVAIAMASFICYNDIVYVGFPVLQQIEHGAYFMILQTKLTHTAVLGICRKSKLVIIAWRYHMILVMDRHSKCIQKILMNIFPQ